MNPRFGGQFDDIRANILIVDDNVDNLVALEAILTSLGENIVCARSGRDALRQVLLYDFAVILMDVRMPPMDGIDTAALIRNREKSAAIPIIFITAISEDEDAVSQGYAVGAVDYIQKPFNARILTSKVRVFVDLYKKNEEVKRQAEQILLAELREEERLRKEHEQEAEQQRLLLHQTELEIKVAERTAQLVAANSEMEAFCYSVSHDLRAPLRAITSTSMILLQDAEERLQPEELDQLRRQSTAAKKLGSLIDDLLLLSRLGRREMEVTETNISEICDEVTMDLSTRYLDRKVMVKIADGLQATGDRRLLRLLLSNLLDNAFKYSPAGGEISVFQEDGDRAPVFCVKDQGIGLDMKYSKKLFLPFERLVPDSEFPGTGIGLAIAHRIVQRHNGRIWAEGAPGTGANFRFTLS